MTRKEIKAKIVQMREDGAEYREISQALAKQGVVGRRSGKPLSLSLISRYLTRPQKSRATSVQASKPHHDRLSAVRSILALKMDAEERIALALLVLQ